MHVPLGSRGDFNPSVVTSLLWSGLRGVSICSRARDPPLFLSPTGPGSACVPLPFFMLPVLSAQVSFALPVANVSFHLTPSDKTARKDVVLEHTHENTPAPLIGRGAAPCNREQIIPVARSMKLASSMDVTGAAPHFQVGKYAPIPYDGLHLPSRAFMASTLN